MISILDQAKILIRDYCVLIKNASIITFIRLKWISSLVCWLEKMLIRSLSHDQGKALIRLLFLIVWFDYFDQFVAFWSWKKLIRSLSPDQHFLIASRTHTHTLTQCDFLARLRRQCEAEQGHGGGQQTGHDQVEAVVQRTSVWRGARSVFRKKISQAGLGLKKIFFLHILLG